MGLADRELSLLLSDDEGIRELNRCFRGVDRATDVLSFPQGEGPQAPGAPRPLGDVVISVERAEAQARERGHSLEREVGELLLHGILHLAGYEHEGSRARKMRAKEAELVRLLL